MEAEEFALAESGVQLEFEQGVQAVALGCGEELTGFVGEGLTLQRTESAESDIDELQDRVAALERGRWPLPAIAAVTGAAGAATGIVALLR